MIDGTESMIMESLEDALSYNALFEKSDCQGEQEIEGLKAMIINLSRNYRHLLRLMKALADSNKIK